MKPAALTAIVAASITALAVCNHQASAVYLGLGLRLHSTVNINGTDRSVWRLYAVVDDPTNYVVAAGATASMPMALESRNFNDTAPGSNFFQSGGNTAPSQEVIVDAPNAEWDTFATIGVAVNDGTDQTATSPGFPTFISGNSLYGDGFWYTPGPVPQGQAVNGLNGTFINSGSSLNGLGILLAQFTVNAGDNVRGTIFVSVNTTNGAPPSVTQPNQVFNSVPAPGAIALLAIAGIFRPARRRGGAAG